jgi:hypothetical protein
MKINFIKQTELETSRIYVGNSEDSFKKGKCIEQALPWKRYDDWYYVFKITDALLGEDNKDLTYTVDGILIAYNKEDNLYYFFRK